MALTKSGTEEQVIAISEPERITDPLFNGLGITTLTVGNQPWYKGVDVGKLLGYTDIHNIRRVIRSTLPSREGHSATMGDLMNSITPQKIGGQSGSPIFGNEEIGGQLGPPTFDGREKATIYISSHGVMKFIMVSGVKGVSKAKDALIDIILRGGPTRPLPDEKCLAIRDEDSLHFKVVDFIRKKLPEMNVVAGLGENQDTDDKRINSWRKGYRKGQPDILIANPHKEYCGFVIELKTPTGDGVLSDAQYLVLRNFKEMGYKTMVSNDYDKIIIALWDYSKGLRYKCPKCKKTLLRPNGRTFKTKESLRAHKIGFHKISRLVSISE